MYYKSTNLECSVVKMREIYLFLTGTLTRTTLGSSSAPWSTGQKNTSPTRLSASTGCACRSEFSTRLPFSSTKSRTDSRRNTLVHSTMSPTCLAADLCVLLAPTVWQCRRLSWQPLPTNRAFPVVGPRAWNDLPDDLTSAESFRQVFTKSFFRLFPGLDFT